MSMLEVVAVAITLIAVFLTTRQVVWCWPLGMVSVVLYGIVFYETRLYAEVGLQALYFALSGYGWWCWLRGGSDRAGVTVTRTPRRQFGVLLIAGGAAGVLIGAGLDRFTGASLPFADAVLAAFSVVAQWMQTRKLLEAWLLWIGLDTLYVAMFAYKELYLTATLYAVFLYLAWAGYVGWRRSLHAAGGPTRAIA
jgi:nicotinamide mononucleotide transporter